MRLADCSRWLAKAEARLFPAHCLVCRAPGIPGRDLCAGCLQALPRLLTACPRCAEPLTSTSPCGRCQQQPPAFERTWAALCYQPPVDQLVQAFKFHGRLVTGRLLGELLHDALRHAPIAEAVLPVPLHPARLRQRGFNQSVELARPLARHWGVPLLTDVAVRVRHTQPQSQLSRPLKARNVRAAFALQRPLAYRHVLLIDDVMTTGSTLRELAQVLKAGGAHTVDVAVVARAGGYEGTSFEPITTDLPQTSPQSG